ncbi:MAG: hypothetical protein E5W90_19730 [Mesorhizobium sp.]|nr:MAG: hypothetical protein E5W90_19730 [Mesorhizobium sp.]
MAQARRRSRTRPRIYSVCAAPHCPAGHFGATALFLPVTIRGEMSGRTMRGGANLSGRSHPPSGPTSAS